MAAPHQLALLLGQHEKAAPVGEAGQLVCDRKVLELPAQPDVLGHVPQRDEAGFAVAPGGLHDPYLDDRALVAVERERDLAVGGIVGKRQGVPLRSSASRRKSRSAA